MGEREQGGRKDRNRNKKGGREKGIKGEGGGKEKRGGIRKRRDTRYV